MKQHVAPESINTVTCSPSMIAINLMRGVRVEEYRDRSCWVDSELPISELNDFGGKDSTEEVEGGSLTDCVLGEPRVRPTENVVGPVSKNSNLCCTGMVMDTVEQHARVSYI